MALIKSHVFLFIEASKAMCLSTFVGIPSPCRELSCDSRSLSRLRRHLVRAAVLVVRRAAQRADALAHAVVAAAAANAPDDRPLAARILVDIQPHVP